MILKTSNKHAQSEKVYYFNFSILNSPRNNLQQCRTQISPFLFSDFLKLIEIPVASWVVDQYVNTIGRINVKQIYYGSYYGCYTDNALWLLARK